MNYRGVIIEESLENPSILNSVKILSTKVEPITPRHQTPWVNQWTLYTFEIPEAKAEKIAQLASTSIDTKCPHTWYIDFRNKNYHYIIFPKKVFKVDLKNPMLYEDVKKYGISLGIPDYQVTFTKS